MKDAVCVGFGVHKLMIGSLRVNRQFIISSIPLLAIFSSELAKAFLFFKLSYFGVHLYWIFALWLVLQFVFATASGILSDYFSRKIVLATLLFGKMVALLLMFNGYVLYSLIVDGAFGNISPVARAAYCDVHVSQKRVPNIINTFIVQPIPWILFAVINFSDGAIVFALFFLAATGLFVLFLFNDFRDRVGVKIKSIKNVLRADFVLVASAFLLMNCQWGVISRILDEEIPFRQIVSGLFLIEGAAFFLGVLITKILCLDVKKTIVFVFFMFFAQFLIGFSYEYVYSGYFGMSLDLLLQLTLFGGIGQPLIYSFLGNKMKVHEQGTGYGLLESVQFLSEMLSPFVLIILGVLGIQYSYAVLLPISAISLVLVYMAFRSRLTKLSS